MLSLPKFTILLSLKPIDSITDLEENNDAISVVAVFEAESDAEYMRKAIATVVQHGTRLVNITVDTAKGENVIDVLVIVSGDVN